jgi:peroxiredoxin
VVAFPYPANLGPWKVNPMPTESSETSMQSVPNLNLPDLHGNQLNLRDYTFGYISVIFFSCNHCPYVRWIEGTVKDLCRSFPDIRWLAICSNDANAYPDDNIDGLNSQIERAGWDFPYLVDTDQEVAREFGAVCTPDFFVFNQDGELTYRGAIDDSRPNSSASRNGDYLRSAVESALLGQVFKGGRNSLGCGIKWKDAHSH